MNRKKLPISVNICTYNEEKDISDCLDRVKENNPSEIIVIDGGSTDKTIEIAKSKGAKVVISKKKGLSSQRQLGIDVSKEDYIALIDGDDHIERDFLEKLLMEINLHKFDALLGREIAYKPKTYWEKAMENVNFAITYTKKPIITNMVGRPSLYRAKVIKKCGFDPFFDGVGDEDTDLSIRMEKNSYKQGIGTGITRRRQTRTFGATIKKFIKYGRGDARIIYKYPFKAKALIFHLLIRYPLIRGFDAIKRGKIKYYPFYFLYGWIRILSLIPEIIFLLVKKPRYKPY